LTEKNYRGARTTNCSRLPPVVDGQADDPREVAGVAGDQPAAVLDGRGSN
jgi:hypothetical protein